MPVRILTDSVADLPPHLVKEFNIKVIPLHIRWGDEVYRDGVDLSAEQFYERFKHSKIPPATSVPTPMEFAIAYDALAQEADGIVAIMVSSRLSGTYDVAFQSVRLMQHNCPVEVFDSGWGAMAQGFIVLEAAKAAQNGASLDEVVETAHQTACRVSLVGTLKTLEYLKRGGRIGKAQAFLGSILKVNPIIALKDSVVEPIGRTRSRTGAMKRLCDYAASFASIEALAVSHAACPEDAAALAAKLGTIFPRERIIRTSATSAIGSHTGPGLLLVAIMGEQR